MPSSTKVSIDVVLQPRNPAALSQYATQVATPASPLYHRYITAAQFPELFGPTSAAITSVYAALKAAGLRPGKISADHLSIPVTATAGQLQSAFGTTLASYRLAGGRTGFANTTAPKLPATIASSVQAVIGLDNLVQMHSFLVKSALPAKPVTASANELTGGPQPCAAAANTGGLTADRLAFSYQFSGLYKSGDFGQGVNVGIVEFNEPNRPSDIAAYQSCYGTHAKVTYLKVDGFHKSGVGEGEAALDIETVIGLAPRAHIFVYRAPNTGKAAFDIYRAIVDQDRVRVISESFGLCEHFEGARAARAVTVLYEQAAVQGQTIVASSGDQGSESCFGNDPGDPATRKLLNANFPASDPLVLGVGGTRLVNVATRPGEVVWNDGIRSGEGATGGGKSRIFSMPSYQKSFLHFKKGVREVPDVSADADPVTGYVYRYNGRFGVIGGTSAAAPLWAALIALTDSKCSASPMGWVNPLIYFTASPKVKAVVLNDITKQKGFPHNVNNDYTGKNHGQYPVKKGYDMATGTGTPVGATLATELCHFGSEAHGYWMASSTGRVFAFHAPFHGSLAGKHLGSKVVAIAGDTHTGGYYLVTAKGKVSAFGAPFHGSVKHPNGTVVGIAVDKSGTGYWVVTSTGHVYAFNAKFHGQAHSSHVVGIALDRQTGGYWIANSGGRVFAFDAGHFKGKKLSGITGIASDPKKQAYWLVNSKGHVFGFNVNARGSMPANVGKVIGIAGAGATGGYWLATVTGHVGAFDATWHGDHPSAKTKIIGIAGSS